MDLCRSCPAHAWVSSCSRRFYTTFLRFQAKLAFTLLALAGPIPKELGNLRELEMLWLNRNQLTGDLYIVATVFIYS